ncbi:MAG: DUF2585 family protein [Sphingomonas bacterium]|nr:DUF2585 family protein [Sphingomonas bacterium]
MTTTSRRAALAAILMFVAVAIILWAMGRSPICTCGTVDLWGQVGPEQSQMLADWYSPSHFIHGLIFYGLLWLVARRQPVERRFLLSLMVEAAWETMENTPLIIDRYREATMALGYSGDTILNSMSDIAMMGLGFLAAWRLPLWASVALAVGFELLTLVIIRDNLTLNVWMLLVPTDAIRDWQAGA